MSEINEKIKQLLAKGKTKEAKQEIIDTYKLSEEKADELIKRLEGDAKKPPITKKLAKGCGCFSVVFIVFFISSLYLGLSGIFSSVEIEATVKGYVTEEFKDESTAKFESYYSPIITYEFEGKPYQSTLSSNEKSPEYEEGEVITVRIDPDYPEVPSDYSIWSVIGDASVYLVLTIFAFVGYRFLKNYGSGNTFSVISPKTVLKKSVVEKIARAKDKIVKESPESEGGLGLPLKGNNSAENSQKNQKDNLWVILVVGFAFLATGLGMGVVHYNDTKRGDRLIAGEKVIGTVVSETRRNSGTGSNRRTTYDYDFQYEIDGRYYTYTANFSMDKYDEGDKVELMVNKDDPSDAAVNVSEDLYGTGGYFWPIIMMLLGAFLLNYYIKQWLLLRK